MPNIEISQFETFQGDTGNDVYFAIASGGANKIESENYKIPFNNLKSHIGVSPKSLDIFSSNDQSIYFGAITDGDSRKVNIQQAGQDVGLFDEFGDFILQNSLHSHLSISGGSLIGTTGYLIDELFVSDVNFLSRINDSNESIDSVDIELENLSGSLDTFSGESLASFASLDSDIGVMGQSILSIERKIFWQKKPNTLDIYETKGSIGLNNDSPQSELDVSGSIFCSKIKIGSVVLYTDSDGDLVFDWG